MHLPVPLTCLAIRTNALLMADARGPFKVSKTSGNVRLCNFNCVLTTVQCSKNITHGFGGGSLRHLPSWCPERGFRRRQLPKIHGLWTLSNQKPSTVCISPGEQRWTFTIKLERSKETLVERLKRSKCSWWNVWKELNKVGRVFEKSYIKLVEGLKGIKCSWFSVWKELYKVGRVFEKR